MNDIEKIFDNLASTLQGRADFLKAGHLQTKVEREAFEGRYSGSDSGAMRLRKA